MAGWAALAEGEGLARWQALLAEDAVLARWLPGADARFAFLEPGAAVTLEFAEGRARARPGAEAPTRFTAPAETWARFLHRWPVRHHHNLFALAMRVPGFAREGEELPWQQHAHLLRRACELARWAVSGEAGPAPESLRPGLGAPSPCPEARGRYLTLRAGGREMVVYAEQHGAGRPVLGLHTAGSDSRQFHRLAAEPGFRAAGLSLLAFDLPGHGRSPPIAAPGAWALTTDLYAEIVLGFLDAWGFEEKPILLGASMSGEICLELALRAPGRFSHILACEACEHIPGRRTHVPLHPAVNAMAFTPEWIEGLMAPQSPAECAAEIWWHYSQGGFGTFPGDILFYSGGWDARGRVHLIDTRACPLTLLTGEYDYSCTQEASAATAAKIAGARFVPMAGIGHFPFAENPALFLGHMLAAIRS
ncbi:alpha/beta fold hydrolase [Rubritepida flocculans]|uniref:alpha/beta fold hydrolase n=1 Tax=Rubritepida flocculans TaxID=182403 RepID=UPI00040D7FB4|nr:alpha/beta hydrolase [Rubritepida flocculans]